MSKFTKALGLMRESRNMSKAAKSIPAGMQSRKDREKLAEEYQVKALWVLGRVTNEAYREYLNR